MLEGPRRISRKEVQLRDYLIVLDRYKWLIVAVVFVTLSATVLYLKRQEPVYQAQASMIIEPKQVAEVFSSQSIFFGTDWLDLETQVEAIKKTPVLASAVKRLGLATAPEGTLEFSAAMNVLRKSIRVALVKNTKMVAITAAHTVPEIARDTANAVTQSYIDQDRLSRLQTGRDAVRWLSSQLADLKIKLRGSEEAFQEFKEREKIVTLDDRRNEESVEMAKLNANYITARANLLKIEAIVSKIENQKSEIENLNIPIALLDTPVLQALGTELSQLQAELADKKKNFKDIYPGVIELKERIQLKEQKILSELKRQRDFLQAQEQSLLAQQEARRNETLKLGRKELEYLTLEREVTTNREMYNALMAKFKELSLAGETDLNNIRIIEPAELPIAPAGGKKMTLIFGGILGLFLGVGLAFFLKYQENTIRTSDDVEQHLDLPVLGVVPHVAEAKESRTPLLMLNGNPGNASAEAYRSLRTNILLSNNGNRPKTIVVTSAGPREGKSFAVANLGMALAQAGMKALLVDADLRRPILHRVFDADRNMGLSTVLVGELSLDNAIVETDIPNLSILSAGPMSINPSEILGSDQMRDVIHCIREQYDIILLDSAPVLGMADTSVLASQCDAVLIVIKTGETPRRALRMVTAQLEQVGVQMCGVVLNDVDVRRDRYYYYSPYEDDEERTAGKWKKRYPAKQKSTRNSGRDMEN